MRTEQCQGRCWPRHQAPCGIPSRSPCRPTFPSRWHPEPFARSTSPVRAPRRHATKGRSPQTRQPSPAESPRRDRRRRNARSLPPPDGGKVCVLISPPVRGAMAQSVARLVRNEKVRGSSPLSSTIFNMALTRSFVLWLAGSAAPYFLVCAPKRCRVRPFGLAPRLRGLCRSVVVGPEPANVSTLPGCGRPNTKPVWRGLELAHARTWDWVSVSACVAWLRV